MRNSTITREQAIHELKRRASRQSLSAFITFTKRDYLLGWVHKEICDKLDKFLEDVQNKKSPRLIICMPPRSGKSEIVSRRFPAYAFGRNPELQIIATSYSSDLSQRFNRDVQRIIDDEAYFEVFPGTTLAGKKVNAETRGSYIRTSDLFEIVGHTGVYRSAGVGGGITGQGADILLIDDPLKDRAEANSATIRNSIWDWYTSTAYTRLSPGGGVIVMATRWHPIKDDVPVLTSKGWKKHGELQVGDEIFGLQGNLIKVTHIGSKVWCDHKAQTRTESIICGANHLWPVKSRPEHNYVLRQSKELLGKKRTFPHIQCLDYGKDEDLPINPYWLGLWLGDGSKSGPDIRCGHGYTFHCENTGYQFTRETDSEGNFVYRYRHQGLRKKLVELGVLFNKHIPRKYLQASKRERLLLLAGLIDSDGDRSVNLNRFANTNKRLFEEVQELIHSLGMVSNNPEVVNKKGTLAKDGYIRNFDCYRLSFSPTVDIPCKVSYKHVIPRKEKDRQVIFCKASQEESGWGRCITTTAKDGIYLVGKSLIPTHNCDDLIGRLIENMTVGAGDTFTVINYPAIAENDEPHRLKGEALHPERYDIKQLEKIQKTIGSRDWAALYQQHPIPDGGSIFKAEWIKYWTDISVPPQFDQQLISWDMTFKDSKNSDYVVGQVWGKKGADFYLLDQVRGQWDFVKTREMFLLLAKKWPRATRKLVEDKANGSAIISELQKTVSGIIPITPKESKEARASAVTPFFEAGNVYIPDPNKTPWVSAFEAEMFNFPAGAHDDMIDSMSQALNYYRNKAGFMLTPELMEQLKYPVRY